MQQDFVRWKTNEISAVIRVYGNISQWLDQNADCNEKVEDVDFTIRI